MERSRPSQRIAGDRALSRRDKTINRGGCKIKVYTPGERDPEFPHYHERGIHREEGLFERWELLFEELVLNPGQRAELHIRKPGEQRFTLVRHKEI